MNPSRLCFTAEDSHLMLPAESLNGRTAGTIMSIALIDGELKRPFLDIVLLELLSITDRVQVLVLGHALVERADMVAVFPKASYGE